MDMDPALEHSEKPVEKLLKTKKRFLRSGIGEAWVINCFEVIWQKYDFLTDTAAFGEHAYREANLMDIVLAEEFKHPYDLDYRFAWHVAERYENIRLARLEICN